MSGSPVDVAIVVVSYNSSDTLKNCLDSLLKHRPRRHSWRILVVDNASADGSADLVRQGFADVELIASAENLGFGRANNLAMDRQPARYYYLHNADAYLQDNVLDPALDYLDANPETGIAGLPLVFPDHSPQTAAYAFSTPLKWALQAIGLDKIVKRILRSGLVGRFAKPLSRLPLARTFVDTHLGPQDREAAAKEVDWVCGAAMIVRNEVKSALGGFDPRIFLYGEDEDLCIEAAKKGWHIEQIRCTPVIHDFGWGKSGRTSPTVARLKQQSLRYFIDKHFPRWRPSWLAMRVLLWLKGLTWNV